MENNKAVAVMESYALGAVAAIRSLGKAGYEVYACSWQKDGLGLKSRFASHAVVHPRYETSEFLPWFRDFVDRHRIGMVIPSEGFVLGIRDCFSEFSHLLPMPGNADVVYSGFSKFDLFSAMRNAVAKTGFDHRHLPPFLLIADGDDTPHAHQIRDLGLPVFIKTDGCHGIDTVHGETYRENDSDRAIERIESLRKRFSKVLVQGFVPGKGAGVYFLIWNGSIVAEFSNVCLHEVPHTGGFCSLRTSYHHREMRDNALQVLEAMNWQGVAMIEYRWDPDTGDFWLIEMNARFWAALHLALYANIDFPKLLACAFFGQPMPSTEDFRDNVRCRWTVPMELAYVRSLMKDPDVPVARWLAAVGQFFVQGLNPRVRSDLWYPGDRRLYWYAWFQFVKGLFKRAPN